MFAIAAVVLVAFACAFLLIRTTPSSDSPRVDSSREWERANARSTSSLDRVLLRAAQPLSNLDLVYERSISPQYRWLQQKLLSAGGVYGGSVEVFLSTQVLTLLLGAAVLIGIFALNLAGVALFAAAVVAAAAVAWPYTQVNKAIKQRAADIAVNLPAFADLLMMPLTSGMGIIPAIAFTSARTDDSVVKREIDLMLATQQSNPNEQAKAFILAGERLGTPEAKAFFTALLQSYTEGTAVSETIEAQAQSLREKAYEQRNEIIQKLPAKISIVLAIHIVPALLIITMLPLLAALQDL